MDAHIDECEESGFSNRRNGKTSKTMKSTSGIFDLETPRDREGSFEPELVKKRQTVLNESGIVCTGYEPYEAISEHLAELYGLEVS